ncbi:MAG TPA: hypothetical protein V6C76_09390 [Drouetiella sp.]
MFGVTRKSLFLSVCALTLQVMPAFADSDAVPVSQVSMQDVSAFEQKYFGHVYDKDTPDKRIQRLELLLFGATQDGGMSERIARVNQYASEHAASPKSAQSGGADNASLSALERKILKKTFDSEPAGQRLTRLESKVFGSASPSMSLGDRVFRLKKMVNIDTPSISRIQPNPRMGDLGMMTPFSGGGMSVIPFGMDGGSGFPGGLRGGQVDEMAQQMNAMINQLNRSLRNMPRAPKSQDPTVPPDATPFLDGVQPFFGQPFSGKQMPRLVPQPKKQDTELPPYLDPNSI